MEREMCIQVLLADDEPGMRLVLRKKLEKTPGFAVCGEASDGQETMALFEKLHPQVVFLDVDMPVMNGVECARSIQDVDPSCVLIFATGHEEYRSDAFEVYAFDYLVKPFKLDRLETTLERIRATLSARRASAQLSQARAAAGRGAAAARLMLRHKDGVSFVDMEDILLVQREERATVMYAEGNRRFVLPGTLSEAEERLDPELFFRCHKSHIVNIRRIRNITPYGRWTYVVQLDGTDHDALITYEKYEELEKRFS